MSTPVLILGKSGSGKTRSILNLDHKKTFVISALKREMTFIGWAKKYTLISKENPKGNFLVSDNYDTINKVFTEIDTNRPEITTIIIDDFQYLMANEFMKRAKEKGFEKFSEIAGHAWKLIFDSSLLRQDLVVVFLAHNETNEHGESKCKTIGKLLDEKICVEGMFNICLNTEINENEYFFATQNSGQNTTKSPEGMFPTKLIANDLKIVVDLINKYNKGE